MSVDFLKETSEGKDLASKLNSYAKRKMPVLISIDDDYFFAGNIITKYASAKGRFAPRLPKENVWVAFKDRSVGSVMAGSHSMYTPILPASSLEEFLIEIATERQNIEGEETIILEDFDLSAFDKHLNVIVMLEKLHKLGVKIAVASSKPQSAFLAILESTGDWPKYAIYNKHTGKRFFVPIDNVPEAYLAEYEMAKAEYEAKYPNELSDFVEENVKINPTKIQSKES